MCLSACRVGLKFAGKAMRSASSILLENVSYGGAWQMMKFWQMMKISAAGICDAAAGAAGPCRAVGPPRSGRRGAAPAAGHLRPLPAAGGCAAECN